MFGRLLSVIAKATETSAVTTFFTSLAWPAVVRGLQGTPGLALRSACGRVYTPGGPVRVLVLQDCPAAYPVAAAVRDLHGLPSVVVQELPERVAMHQTDRAQGP